MILVAVCVSLLASAPDDDKGSVAGTIVDAVTLEPAADVLVTITRPGLGIVAEVISGADGSYVAAGLPAGGYTVTFEKESYRKTIREGLNVHASRPTILRIDLIPESTDIEVVFLGCRIGPIDVSSSSTGVTLTPEFTQHAAGLFRARGGM